MYGDLRVAKIEGLSYLAIALESRFLYSVKVHGSIVLQRNAALRLYLSETPKLVERRTRRRPRKLGT